MDNIIYSPSGAVSLHISDDKMSAWMTIHATGHLIDEQEILALIDDAGICNGMDNALQKMAEEGFQKDFDKPFPIALCTAVSSQHELKLLFETGSSYQPGKSWSFADVQSWVYVQAGDALAEISYNLFKQGESVYNIFGEIAYGEGSYADINALVGNNVSVDASHRIVADITGYPYIDENGKVNVLDSLEWEGDLEGLSTPLTLATSITIKGNLRNVNLTALRDVTINGDVENASLYTEGDLTVLGRIRNCPDGIIAKGNVRVKGISSSLLLCEGELSFDQDITGSRIIAQARICGDIDHGAIIGSQVQTAGSIDIASAGDADGSNTEMEITLSPYSKERMTQLTRQMIRLKDSPNPNHDRIEEINNELHILEQNISDELNQFIDAPNTEGLYIKVHRDIYPGVYIRILKRAFTIKTYQTYAEFTQN